MLSWARCRYTEIAQRILKFSDTHYINLTPDKILNSLMYRTLFYVYSIVFVDPAFGCYTSINVCVYVNIYGSYKLSKNSPVFLGPPCTSMLTSVCRLSYFSILLITIQESHQEMRYTNVTSLYFAKPLAFNVRQRGSLGWSSLNFALRSKDG